MKQQEDKTFRRDREAIVAKTLRNRSMRRPVFAKATLNQQLIERDSSACDGSDKSWVHATQLAWLRHYQARRRKP